jgi:pimeloyl-ACP methyl ester carboxylesterase
MRTGLGLFLLLGLCAGACGRFRRTDAGVDVPDPDVLRGPAAVQFPSEDGWTLAGTLYSARAADDTGAAVVLVHQLGSHRWEWAPLVDRLQRGRTVTVLALDLRGHGESTRGPHGVTPWESFGTDPARWAGLPGDVLAAVRFLRTSGAVRRVALVGSSIGASAALVTAANDADVSALVLLSPGLGYHGIDAAEPMRRYVLSHRPALLLAGGQDPQSAQAVPALGAGAGPEVTAEVLGGTPEHGVGMLNRATERWDRLDQWLRTALQVPPRAPPPRPHAPQGAPPVR